jgi:tetratricopeptide (TPR) repeat protein
MAAEWEIQYMGKFQIRRRGRVVRAAGCSAATALIAYLAYRKESLTRLALQDALFSGDSKDERFKQALYALEKISLPDGQGNLLQILRQDGVIPLAHGAEIDTYSQWSICENVETDRDRFEQAATALQLAGSDEFAALVAASLEADRLYNGKFMPGFRRNIYDDITLRVIEETATGRLRKEVKWIGYADECLRQMHRQIWRTLGDAFYARGDDGRTHVCRVRAKAVQYKPLSKDDHLFLSNWNTADTSQTNLKRGAASSISMGLPPLKLMIDREDALKKIKIRLRIDEREQLPGRAQMVNAICGGPGVGTTTLAIAVAQDTDVNAAFPDGVVWKTLGPSPNILTELSTLGRFLINDRTDNIQGVSRLVNDQIGNIQEASEALGTLLRQRRMLLILDDVWDEAHARPFMVGGSGCAILITTRNREVARNLALPDDVSILDGLTDEHALALLRKLAPTVVARYPEQCRKLVQALEGSPLALRVAGRLLHAEADRGWIVEDLLEELRAGTKLLDEEVPLDYVDVVRETTPTIAVLLRKSTDRLDPQAHDCFAQLGVFAPGPATFDLKAIQAMWPRVSGHRRIINTLLDRGLLERLDSDLFKINDLLILHARALLGQKSDPCLSRAERRHAIYYLTLAEQARPYLMGWEQATWLGRLESAHDNLRLVLERCKTLKAGGKIGLRLTGALARFWGIRGHLSEGRQHLSRVLLQAAGARPSKALAYAFSGAGSLAYMQGDYKQARSFYEQSLVIQRTRNDQSGIATILSNLGVLEMDQGDFAAAQVSFNESLSIRQALGDRRGIAASLSNLGVAAFEQDDPVTAQGYFEESLTIQQGLQDERGIATSLTSLGVLEMNRDNFDIAREFFEQSLAIQRQLGDKRGSAQSLVNLGEVALAQGDPDAAYRLLTECLTLCRELGDRYTIAYALEGYARLSHARQQPERAVRLYGAAAILRESIGVARSSAERTKIDRNLAGLRADLGEVGFNEAINVGRALSIEQMADLAAGS